MNYSVLNTRLGKLLGANGTSLEGTVITTDTGRMYDDFYNQTPRLHCVACIAGYTFDRSWDGGFCNEANITENPDGNYFHQAGYAEPIADLLALNKTEHKKIVASLKGITRTMWEHATIRFALYKHLRGKRGDATPHMVKSKLGDEFPQFSARLVRVAQLIRKGELIEAKELSSRYKEAVKSGKTTQIRPVKEGVWK